MHLKPGQQMSFLRVGQSLRLVPVLKLEDLFGIGKGANTDDIRDRSTRREDSFPVPSAEQKAAFPENMQRLTDMLNAKRSQ